MSHQGFAGLTGTAWRALTVAGKAPVAGREPTIAFAADRVTGSGGCNGFGGPYHQTGRDIQFGDLAMTLMGCTEAIGSTEGTFMRILSTARTATVDGSGRLTIEGPDGLVVLAPDAPAGS
jgi:heat shock protein HslJ